MVLFRRIAVLLASGALAGAVVSTLIARSFIPWYESPGDAMGTQQLCNLPKIIRATIDQVLRYQLLGAALGAVVVLVAGLVVGRAMTQRKPA